MRNYLFVLIFLLGAYTTWAQEHAWVYFTDKPNASVALASPLSILTQDALDRKAAHNISIDVRDVPVDETYITTIKNQAGITVMAKSKWMNCVHVIGTQSDINALESLSIVDSVFFADNSLNAKVAATAKDLEQTNKFDLMENFVYGNTDNQVTMLNVDVLHQNDYTGEGLVIAVLDAGFPNVNTLNGFQRLRDNNDLLGGYDFVLRSTDFNNPSLSQHGTMVLSDMAGYVQDMFVGTAPDASYYLFRTEDAPNETPVEESYWVEAAERADSLGVDIINSSLGYTTFDEVRYNHTMADMDGNTAFVTKGANIAVEKGILVVNSAGNSGNSSSFYSIGAPADGNVFTIGAVDANGNYASFSSIGPNANGTVKPDVMAKGAGSAIINYQDLLTTASGTSFSSPIMAGSVACLWQVAPSKTNLEIMQLVRESASLYNNPTDLMGYGIPDFSMAMNNLLAVNTVEADFNVYIYPNPVADKLYISNSRNSSFSIQIFNTLGKQVLAVTNTKEPFVDVSTLKRDIYIVKIQVGDLAKTIKLIKE
ncbi:S8 family serine peptidase [Neptunitalea lumnitzerae]|uniref:Peptidase S8 n=1 Tax=Neptunitalea lumnitzerae TaxID=2965509 RepID=A0ABQ5MNL1_9FLAO|nr:S8 family serine peptidase [Neptunitalea sp. Y10]GLB50947.1 peptidase S8 [Neptunitalea sp. Y10]